MTDTKEIKITARVPLYPFPADEEGPRRFQSAGELEGSTVIEINDTFGKGDLVSKERELAGFINNFAKGFHETLMADPSAAKLYMVKKEPAKNSTETHSDRGSGRTAINNAGQNWGHQNQNNSTQHDDTISEKQIGYINSLLNPQSWVYKNAEPRSIASICSRRADVLPNYLNQANLT